MGVPVMVFLDRFDVAVFLVFVERGFAVDGGTGNAVVGEHLTQVGLDRVNLAVRSEADMENRLVLHAINRPDGELINLVDTREVGQLCLQTL